MIILAVSVGGIERLRLDQILDCNDRGHHEHHRHRWLRPLEDERTGRMTKESRLQCTNFVKMQRDEVIVDHHHFHPIFSNDVMHFVVVTDKISHPNPRK